MMHLHPGPRSTAWQAIGLMLLSMACFAAMNTAIRYMAGSMPSPQLVMLRNIASLLLIVLWQGLLTRRLPYFTTRRLTGHFWRATAGICAMEAWFYSLTVLPLTLATALSFTTPIFSTVIAILWLGERAGVHRWSAIVTGFIGMLVILQPGAAPMSPDALFVLFSSVMMGISGTLVKSLTRTESPETIVFFMAFFMVLWSILPVIGRWQPVTLHQLAIVLLIGLLSTTAHLLMARAFHRADLVTLMPFDFTRLIFTAIFAFLLFGETLSSAAWLGALIIVGSTVYIAHREARTGRIYALPQENP